MPRNGGLMSPLKGEMRVKGSEGVVQAKAKRGTQQGAKELIAFVGWSYSKTFSIYNMPCP